MPHFLTVISPPKVVIPNIAMPAYQVKNIGGALSIELIRDKKDLISLHEILLRLLFLVLVPPLGWVEVDQR